MKATADKKEKMLVFIFGRVISLDLLSTVLSPKIYYFSSASLILSS